MQTIGVLLVMLFASLGHGRVFAQFEGPGWGIVVNQIGLYNAMDTLQRSHATIFGPDAEKSLTNPTPPRTGTGLASNGQGLGGAPGPTLDTRFSAAPASRSTVAATMAEAYPPAHRAQARQVFGDMLAGYRKIERQFDIPPNDLAGAVAAFIAGSYMAYRNRDFPDQHFVPLVSQMRSIINQNARFAQATAAERRETYERMATLGMLMASTQMALKAKPNAQLAASLRQTSKGYLEAFLRVDADRVQIGDGGLTLK